MSWSIVLRKPVIKAEAAAQIDAIPIPDVAPDAADQIAAAKDVAKLLLKSLPGPFIMFQANGHSNGVGWQKKPGWSDDSINVSVSQVVDPPAE